VEGRVGRGGPPLSWRAMKRWAVERALAVETEAERELGEVPDWMWDGESLPVPLETIADSHYGLLVREEIELARMVGLDDAVHISGLLVPGPREIWIDAEEALRWPGRRRFTIAHEVGHWVLHCEREGSGDEAVHCRTETLSEQGTTDEEDARPTPPQPHYPPPRERDANRFAAALLMPRALVEVEHAYLDGDERRLANAFGVSVLAMEWRLWFLEQLAT
jgi:IrrE N-terminal-like domain